MPEPSAPGDAARAARSPTPWRAEDVEESSDWLIPLDEGDFEEFDKALEANRHREMLSLTKSDFPLRGAGERLERLSDCLQHGLGFAVLRGLPVHERYDENAAARIFWGIGSHLGTLVTQNRKGELLGDLRDLGTPRPHERIYATNAAQGLHTDSTDYAGLLCLRQGVSGGDSLVASTLALYDVIVREHPDYRPTLFKSFPTDWKGEEPPGSPGWYLEPLFSDWGGVLSGTVRTGRIVEAQRFEEVPRLTEAELECLRYIESVPERPGVTLLTRLEPGDMQFVNNFITLHGRTAFVDGDAPECRRHLLRLWISLKDDLRPLCPEYAVWRQGYAR